MTFNPLSEPVDYILLANRRSPGLATIAGADTPRRWDERRGIALSGSRVVYRGLELSKPIVRLVLLTEDDWAAWHEWKPLVERPPRGERARAKDIWHPILEDQGVTAVNVQDVLQPMQTADGEWTIEIRFIEHREPVRINELIAGSETVEEPDEAQQIILSMQNQINALQAEET